ncbi:arylsulfatase A-like enzyme [Prosthecobacter fusiformis]|uniref:Arylsulfatase A-like enzyme n=1 Tax=Prosthecobacter fusiformis TaxID=48464 RepID=A0A4R7SQA6_9BACT|nr:arylsulfatase [Prosthecobacter fusiformis]TDU80769.1 arylsulfatase A-like enzyme [Prosthecobacter fusiformis]
MKPILHCLMLFAVTLIIAPVKAAPPNIIYILADDLGYGDLGSYGQKLTNTPRLDKMAAQGIRFIQHYAGAPSCHPSRCVLFTGKHAGHGRIRANSDLPLLPEDFTISQMMKKAGYATGGVGKWALGQQETTGAPWVKGMDEFLGYLDQTLAHSYYPDHLWKDGQRMEIPENKDGQRKVYSHDLFAEQSLDFIRRHKDGPFFFYAALTIPHAEMAVPEDSLAEYRGKWPEPKTFPGSKTYCPQDQPRAVRAAMITRMDRDIGRILDLLDELKIADNTLVMFSSDNGPITAGGSAPEFFDSNGPLRDLKFKLYEGGIRVPFIARWPGKIKAGAESKLVSDFADMMPTFAEVSGAEAVKGDGRSILPTLLGKDAEQEKREVFYWEAAPQQALRKGDWKIYRRAPNAPIELYDLSKDIGETTDLATSMPEKVAELEKLMMESRMESSEFPLAKKEKKKKKH